MKKYSLIYIVVPEWSGNFFMLLHFLIFFVQK